MASIIKLGRIASYSVILLAVSKSTAQADPFAILFGDAPANVVSAEGNDEAHEDNIRLLSVHLREQPLIDIISAYELADDICMEVSPLFEALNLPVKISEDTLTGWDADPSQALTLDLLTGIGSQAGKDVSYDSTQFQNADTDWCIGLKPLSKITNIDFTYEPSTLKITALPRSILPIEAKLERARLRAAYLMDTETVKPNYAKIETPYEWLSMPSADIVFDAAATQAGGVNHTLSLDLAGDILKATGHLRTVTSSASAQPQSRFTLGRVSEHANQFGIMRARQFSVGDISTPSLPLIGKSQSGVGALISNKPNYSPTLFDSTEIRGHLPTGWEAELYQNERLIAFSDTANSNGEYVFLDVPLTLGYNRVVVKLYGPYGETEERVISQFVGGEQCPDNQLRYTVGVISPRQAKTGRDASAPQQSEALTSEPQAEAQKDSPFLLATAEYGLTKNLSARLDAAHHLDTGKVKTALSFLGSSKSLYGGIRLASDGTGRAAIETFAQKRFNQNTSLSGKWINYGEFVSDYSGSGSNRTRNEALLRMDSQLGAFFKHMPIQARLDWKERESGDANFSAQTIVSSQYKGLRWSHALKYSNAQSNGKITDSQLGGNLIASKNVKDIRFRAGMDYTLHEKAQINNISLSAQRSLKDSILVQASAVYDMQAKTAGVESVFSKPFKHMNASFRAGISQSGDWHAGLSLAFSLYSPKDKMGYRLAPPGLSRMGAVRLLAYEDVDGNDQFSGSDAPTENVKYIVANSLRSEKSGPDGSTFITGVEPHISTDIELQISSLDDPFLRPSRLGRSVKLRPGKVIEIPFPLLSTGDIDGVITLSKGENETPLAGVIIEAVDADGLILATSRSEYDGYYYIDDVPAKTISLRIAQDDLDIINGEAAPQIIELSNHEPSKSGVDFTITQ